MSKRIKHVFGNAWDVAHLWAQQIPEQEHANSRNLTYTGPTLYSYGHWWIGHFVRPDVVLLRDARYSHTTSKHQNAAAVAVHNKVKHIFTVSKTVEEQYKESVEQAHGANLQNYLDNMQTCLDRYKRSRLAHNFKWEFTRWQNYRAELRSYCRIFKLPMPKYKAIQQPYFQTRYDKAVKHEADLEIGRTERQAKAAAYREAHRAKLIAEKQVEFTVLENDWLAGLSDKTSLVVIPGRHRWSSNRVELEFPCIRLRPCNDKTEIETSNHARIPYKAGRLIYAALKRGDNLVGRHIGSFEINEHDTEHIRAGCTIITMSEIERFAKQENWS
jgi:hypothetical protein